MTFLFDLQHETLSYENTVVFQDLNLRIEDGEKIALIGPSGAGKTTLLRKLYSLAPQDSAFIDQHYALVPELSAFHNTYIGQLDAHSTWYNLLNLVVPQKKKLDEILPILDQLGLQEKHFTKVAALSGGQQQRVAIARAMYRKRPILLGDEPVSSIDPHQATTVMQELMNATKTIILSLHSVELALLFAKRIIGIRFGKILFDLPTIEVSLSLLKELYAPC